MSDYIEREVAIESVLSRYFSGMGGMKSEALREIMNSVPAADVAPVVRCRDCVFWTSNGTGWCNDYEIVALPDFYCAGGERKWTPEQQKNRTTTPKCDSPMA